jgi:hypothetical protein
MATLETFLKGFDPYGSTNALNRKQLLAQQLQQQGAQATNPFINLLASAVGSYQLADAASEQKKIDRQEAELKKALLLDEAQRQDRSFGLQERQLGISAGSLDLQRQKLAQELSQSQQQSALRSQMMGALTNQPQSAPSPEFTGPMPIERGLSTDPQKLSKVAIAASLLGDKDLANSLSGVIKSQATSAKELAKNPLSLSEGEKAVDKEYKQEFVDFTAKGGFADGLKGIEQLRIARQQLETGQAGTGPERAFIPGFAEELLIPKSKNVQESIEEVVQRNLRLVLGAQFTEKEGERLISRAFNPKLKESQNIERLKRLETAMETALKTKAEAAQYFRDNGTLKGFNGKIPSITDIESAITGVGKVVEELPKGAVQIGTSGGKPVYKTPDGRQFVGE